jgi:C-terminal processing protease CtpA/Prc
MSNWGFFRARWDWKAWLAEAFTQIASAGTRRLVIDLRGNEGGRDEVGPELLGYLTATPLSAQAGQRRLRYRTVDPDLNPVLETWDNSFRDWGDRAVARPDGFYDLNDNAGRSGGAVAPKDPHFSGTVVVLTDAAISSATLQFCQMFRANRLGTIMGETTGGNLRGINAEKFFFARLPGTGIEVDVPLVGFFPDGNPADSGLVPDRIVRTTWQDVASARDPVLAAAIA